MSNDANPECQYERNELDEESLRSETISDNTVLKGRRIAPGDTSGHSIPDYDPCQYGPPKMFVDCFYGNGVDGYVMLKEVKRLAELGEVDLCTLIQACLYWFAQVFTHEQNDFEYCTEAWHRLQDNHEKQSIQPRVSFGVGSFPANRSDALENFQVNEEHAQADRRHEAAFMLRRDAIRELILCIDHANAYLLNPLEGLLFGTCQGLDDTLGEFVNQVNDYALTYKGVPASKRLGFWPEHRIAMEGGNRWRIARLLEASLNVESEANSSTPIIVEERATGKVASPSSSGGNKTDGESDADSTKQAVKGKDINARILAKIADDDASIGWPARKWAIHLDCAKSTVVESDAWKNNVARLRRLLQVQEILQQKSRNS